MVMEAPPSPQSVGREFVRQYYTLLNKAPTHLHRFYNHQSSFVHGGLDPPSRETSPVIGQKQIHQKIQQLNFRDCHAKITQVDSQATLGNGVVVQVTGELSNAGQPMRRFTQTFVLAAQSPKKYYVHNDIFRYQDEIVSDEECDAVDARSDVDAEDVVPERQIPMSEVQQQTLSQPAIPQYYNQGPIQPNLPQVPIHHSQPPHVLNAPQAVPAVNGAVHPEDINVMPGQVPPHVSNAQPQGLGGPNSNLQAELVQAPLNPLPAVDEQQQQSVEGHVEQLEPSYTEPQESEPELELPIESASNEPKTYANLLKSGYSNPPYGGLQAQVAPVPVSQPVRSASPPLGANQGLRGVPNSRPGQRVPNQQQQQLRTPNNRQDLGRGGSIPGRNSINEDGSFDDRRRSQSNNFSDVNQLFLGNLPHNATEEELRDIFIEFGVIVDLKVHSKPANKIGGLPGGRAPPNYGFITYESQQSVQNCLQAKPIFYPKDDKTGTLLNVEEKKTKDRPSYGSGGRPGMDNSRGRGDNNGPRRGIGGGPGGPNRNSAGVGGLGMPGGPNTRNNSYSNRSGGGGFSGGPPNRGHNTYNRR